jgi:alcohol dehydrogenase class IV
MNARILLSVVQNLYNVKDLEQCVSQSSEGELELSYRYSSPVYVEFGESTSRRVGSIAKSKGYKKILVVTDCGIVKAGLADPVIQSLQENSIQCVMFDKVEPNPKDATVESGLQILREERCDSVIAVGGGSSLDVGKAVSMIATNGGEARDYEIRTDTNLSEERIKKHSLPLFTVPTTAGTGSEIDFWAVITDTARKIKMLIGQAPLHPGGPYMGATVALVDPTMTLTLPPAQTAATGFDAFIHALESYLSPATPPLFRLFALDAAELSAKYLPIAYAQGKNREAREKMMLAAHIGGICISFGGLGAIHALAEAIGGLHETVPHGYALSAVAPAVLKYNSPAFAQQYFELERRIHPEHFNLSPERRVDALIKTVVDLIEAVHLPQNLRNLNIKLESLQEIADHAVDAIEMTSNPRKLQTSDLLEVLKEAF